MKEEDYPSHESVSHTKPYNTKI